MLGSPDGHDCEVVLSAKLLIVLEGVLQLRHLLIANSLGMLHGLSELIGRAKSLDAEAVSRSRSAMVLEIQTCEQECCRKAAGVSWFVL